MNNAHLKCNIWNGFVRAVPADKGPSNSVSQERAPQLSVWRSEIRNDAINKTINNLGIILPSLHLICNPSRAGITLLFSYYQDSPESSLSSPTLPWSANIWPCWAVTQLGEANILPHTSPGNISQMTKKV